MTSRFSLAVAALVLALPSMAIADNTKNRLSDIVGPGEVGAKPTTDSVQVPFITWGGDMATFHANGGLTTKPGSIFHKLGLNIKLVPGDDFPAQIRDYRSGKSPFLRCTLNMAGLASEVINSDPRTKGVAVLQLTWSVGDHMIVRPNVKNPADLKGKTVVLQQAGPHVGMLDDILRSANLTWDDIKIVWAKDLTGSADSPAEIFRKRPDIDACFAITPDMVGLCGGLRTVGTGAEGTVKGSRVLVSTSELSRSIADVYVCRKDFFDANKDFVTKFTAGYLKACEEIVDLKKQYEGKGSEEYKKLLKTTQDIYGKTVIPTIEDAHGLISDCVFVGYPGNLAFFKEKGSLHGFDALMKAALDSAVGLGYVKERLSLLPSGLDWQSPTFTGLLTKTSSERKEKFRAEAVREEIESLAGGALDDRTILQFTIMFEPNQNDFSAEQYGAEFKRVVELADKFANAVIAIRGHSDPTKTLRDFVAAGMKKGILKRSGTTGNYSYSLNGQPLDVGATEALVKLIDSGAFDGVSDANPRETLQSALNLSKSRAESVRDSIIAYAKEKGVSLDKSQIQPVGVGVREPFIAKPVNMDQAKQNMRVEFRLMRVQAEAAQASDFDF